ncbi:hypothetical protein B6U98_03010 [Thermoplasmatales archaeon ex4572_165]|nr:MAG: hypothetical protein B6U98_03010 [Thermoplasmatales archaeon ex4572_165]
MKKVYQYRNVKHLEYIPSSGKLTMNIDGSDDDYVTQANNVEMDILSQDFRHVKHVAIKSDALHVDFLNPINCNLESSRYDEKLICNVDLEGENTTAFVEKIPGLADRIIL